MPSYNQTVSYPFGIVLTLKFPEEYEIAPVSSPDPTNDLHLWLVFDKNNFHNMQFKEYFIQKGTYTKLGIQKTRLKSINQDPDFICKDDTEGNKS